MRALILTAVLAAPVQAQTACAPLEAFLAGLAERYAEAPRASGLMQGGQLLIITASESGTWTALVVTPEQMACMAASGEGFGLTEAPKPGVDG